MNRFQNALYIQEGACNPSGIALTIIEACREIRGEGKGTQQICEDPAVRLMVHQLAHLCRIYELDSTDGSFIYSELIEECKQYAKH